MKRKKSSKKKVKGRVASTKNFTAKKERQRIPTVNIIVVLAIWLGASALFYSGRLVKAQTLTLGQQAPDTIVASVEFNAETLAATKLARRTRAEAVLPVFHIDTAGIDQAQLALEKLIPRLQTLSTATEPDQRALLQESVEDRLDLLSISLSVDDLLLVCPTNGIDLQIAILSTLTPAIRTGIISENEMTSRFNGTAHNQQIAVRGDITETIRPLDSFTLRTSALQDAVNAILAGLPKAQRDEHIIRSLIAPWMQPNIVFDETETITRREQAREVVEPIIEAIGRGAVLIRNGDTVTEQTLEWLSAYDWRVSALESRAERIQRVAASSLLLLIGLGLVGGITGIVSPKLIHNRRNVLVILLISALPLILTKLILTLSINFEFLPPSVLNYAIPLSLAPLLVSILLGGVPGVLAGVWTSFALATVLGNNFDVFLQGSLVSIAAVYATRDTKRRINLFRAGLIVAAVKIGMVLILAVLNQPTGEILLMQLSAALINGLGCALITILLIPLYEKFFGITTDITLLELSDLSHPLLQSLALNAPGTYHHSLMLASLAQHAAEKVGANGLQLRVCAYFHDIGKLVKPRFFSENIQFDDNPHDELAPSMSTLVIVSHVKEGMTLARKHKLPQVILDGIEQHQGTSLVSVFYHRAKSLHENADAINDEDFRYDGPRPKTKEMAILMLADSCEAASRSLEKPNATRLNSLIGQIFDSRLHDGQLDKCNLTFAELTTIREAFVFSLTNMLHGRIAYPKDENASDKQSKDTPA